jgi:hypothetical protein
MTITTHTELKAAIADWLLDKIQHLKTAATTHTRIRAIFLI